MSTLINDIRNIDESLKNAKIKDITVHRISRTVDAEVISDKAVSDDIRREVAATIARVLPGGFTLGCVNVSKILADGELVAKSVLEFIDKEYKSAAHSLTLSDIVTITGDGICRYTIKVHDDAYEYFINNRITDAIDLYLADIYCGKFIGDVQTKGKAEIDTDILKVNTDASDFSAVKLRTYTVADPVKLWGEDVDSTAVYMADADVVSGEVTFAGTVTSIMQKETKNGKPFYIYKFRSMRLDAEKFGPALYKGGEDSRLTKIGKILREHHLNELPQLWNVFVGDMAFIGPRPERKFYIDQIMERDPRYRFLYQIRPGVTSYATLYNGYTDTMEKMLRRLRYDLFYLEHRSWFFDFKILVKTFLNIAFGKKF